MATKKAASEGNGVVTRAEFSRMEQRVEALEAARPGRKARPMLVLRQEGVCSLDPERDSNTCPDGDASIFRYQVGCHGYACKRKQHEAYERRKVKKQTEKAAAAKPKKAPAKKAPTKAAPVKAAAIKAPVKKAVAPVRRVTKKAAAVAS